MGTELFFLAVILLAGFAILDLMVGVSNDAVNFLNSSIGSRAAPRYVILIIARLGILAGVTFSSGMMEVARKGIFHPELFTMPELMTIFLAVMLTDVILLDLFNTFGLPTSTTVSIVFELLGAAVAVSDAQDRPGRRRRSPISGALHQHRQGPGDHRRDPALGGRGVHLRGRWRSSLLACSSRSTTRHD